MWKRFRKRLLKIRSIKISKKYFLIIIGLNCNKSLSESDSNTKVTEKPFDSKLIIPRFDILYQKALTNYYFEALIETARLLAEGHKGVEVIIDGNFDDTELLKKMLSPLIYFAFAIV